MRKCGKKIRTANVRRCNMYGFFTELNQMHVRLPYKDQLGRQLEPIAESFNAIVLSRALQDDTWLLTNKDVDVIQSDIEKVFDNFTNTMNTNLRPITEDDILIDKASYLLRLIFQTRLYKGNHRPRILPHVHEQWCSE